MSACETSPVLMIVTGITHDRERMDAYGRALAESRLYDKFGGYYLNNPRPAFSLQGELPADHTALVVRFASEEAVRAFWSSETYQKEIKPLRENPDAGTYTVTVYREIRIASHMEGRVVAPVFRGSEKH